MDDAAWAALTISLTALGGIWTWISFRRSGLVAGARALGFTLLPLAAYLTKTLQMFTEIGQAIGSWATHLVLSPIVWAGFLLGGAGIVLIVVSGMVRARQLAASPEAGAPALPRGKAAKPGKAGKAAGSSPAIDTDDEMAEIEALLRKRGIQ